MRFNFTILVSKTDGRINRLYLFVFRCLLAVATHDTFHAECLEVGNIIEVSTIRHHLLAVARRKDSLVSPFPNETAQHARMTVNLVPVFLEVAKRITHGMSVFARENRTIIRSILCDR